MLSFSYCQHTVALERAAWSEPVEAGAISARGRLQAAEGQAAELLAAIRTRGCKEAFLANPALLQEGKVRAPRCCACASLIAARRGWCGFPVVWQDSRHLLKAGTLGDFLGSCVGVVVL